MTPVSPAEFLKTLLVPAGPDAVAWCTYFAEPPTADAAWSGRKYEPAQLPFINGANAYYSIAAFPDNAEHRRKEAALGACVVIVDDVGTKSDRARVLALLGAPSFIIQTSALSQQWGYLLDALAADEEIKPIHDKLVELKLCDKSGNSLVRYGRLPAGINNKPEYPESFAVRCVEWHPERRFDIADIAGKLAATPSPPRATDEMRDDFESLAALIESGEAHHDPLVKLAAKCAAKGYAQGDIVAILKGHMLSSETRSAGWQGHFDDIERTVNTAVKKFKPGDRGDTIALRAGQNTETVNAVLAVLARRGVASHIFRRGTDLVRPYIAKRRGFHGTVVESLELAVLNPAALIYELGALVTFVRKSGGKGGSTRTAAQDCPKELAHGVLSVYHEWGSLPALEAIASAPIYLGNGLLIATPGYHESIGVWLTVPAGVKVAECLTLESAATALERLHGWIREFPFAGELDRAVMVAGIMTAVLRASLPAAPGVAIDAPEYGSGKTTAAKVCHLIGTGRLPSVIQFPKSEEEMAKRIDAVQMEGRQAIVIDNVPTGLTLTSDALAQALTEPERQVRELGRSKTHRVACSQLVLATGNNLTIGEDLVRRMIVARLDPDSDPTARKFERPDLLDQLARARASVLSDVFTIVAAYEAAAEKGEMPLPLVGYEQWCAWVQRPLVWLGMSDPVESTRVLQEEDPDRALLERVVELWLVAHGTAPLKVAEIAKYQDKAKELDAIWRHEVARGDDGRIDFTKLGNWLKRVKGRWTKSGVRIVRLGSAKSAAWGLEARVGGQGGQGGQIHPESRSKLFDRESGVEMTPSDPSDPQVAELNRKLAEDGLDV